MNLRYFLLGGVAVLLGFLLYPRSDEVVDQEFVKPARHVEDEPLHYTDILRTTPIYTTYDLGYVYKIDKVDVRFDNPNESGPKQYDLLVQTDRTKTPFLRAFSYVGNSREYTYPLQSLPISVEARWVQVVINDWFSDRPNLKTEEFRVGVRYESQSQFLSITANYNNSVDLQNLTDLRPFENSKWIGARKIKEKVKTDDKTERRISYEAAIDDIEVTADLGVVSKIYGIRLTTDGPGDNLKSYRISISTDGRKFSEVYASKILPDETVTDFHLFDSFHSPHSNPTNQENREREYWGRYIRLHINRGDWYGSYPELREFEVFTDTYRLPPATRHQLSDYNAIQMHYENLGEAGNSFAPHLVQGFAFDRDTRDESHYFLEPDRVDAGNTPSQMSFAYHYDQVKLRYTGLNPSRLYWVQVTYLQEKGGGRIQNFVLDGFILQEAMLVPEGKAVTNTFVIPSETYADGTIELNFYRLAGPNAVVSEVSILEARVAREMDFASRPSDQQIGRAIRVPSDPISASRVVVDGRINEWPQLYPLLPDGYETKATAPVVLHTQWDDDNLYIAAVINQQAGFIDNEQIYSLNRARSTLKDSEALHLFVDTALHRSPGMYTSNDHHFVFTVSNPQRDQPRVVPSQIHHHLDAIPNNIDHHHEIEAKAAKTDTGYTLEARIPRALALSEFHPLLGQRIGLNYVMENLKLADNRSRWFAYATSDLTASPDRWNVLQLVNQVSAQAAIIGQSQSRAPNQAVALAELDGHTPQSHTTFNSGDVLTLCVWDTERNEDRHQSESIQVELRNAAMGQSQTVVLYESDPVSLINDDPENGRTENSSLFAAEIQTVYRGNESADEARNSGDVKNLRDAIPKLTVDGKEVISLTYIDPYYSTTQRNHPVKTFSTVNTGTTGIITITDKSGESIQQFQLGDTIHVRVRDTDLDVGDPALSHETEARLLVPETQEIEIIRLSYEPEKDYYTGAMPTAYSQAPQPGDGVLQSVGTRPVWALYLDEIQDTGMTNVPVSAKVSATIGQTAHIELSPNTELIAINNFKFFYAGESLSVWLTDTDLNRDNGLRETIKVALNGDLLNDQYKLTLTETTAASGEFTGSCQTRYARSSTRNDVFEVTGKEIVTVSHLDLLQGSGETNVFVTDRAQVKAGNDGTIEIVKANYITPRETFNAGDTLYFRLHDEDIVDDAVEIALVGDVLHDHETVRLFQSPTTGNARVYPLTGVFFGSIPTTYDVQRVEADGQLQVTGKEQIRVTYIDALRSTGKVSVEILTDCVANVGTTGSLKIYNKANFSPDQVDCIVPSSSSILCRNCTPKDMGVWTILVQRNRGGDWGLRDSLWVDSRHEYSC